MKVYPLFYLILSILGLFFYMYSPNFPDQYLAQLGGGLAFWLGIGYLILKYPLRTMTSKLKEKRSWMIFSPYIVAHYLAYSLLLNAILGVSSPSLLALTYAPMDSVNPSNLIELLFSPSISIGAGAYIDLSFFAILMGIVIGLLVLGNLLETKKFRNVTKLAIPVIGIIGGSTCCISIASIVAYYDPILSGEVSNDLMKGVVDTIFIGLPLITSFFLWLNYRLLSRVPR
ncbi:MULTISPECIES: hypothetical protein [Metallosphaera]|uniref:Uncharacterized protein n=1 Tax=Metallosphaera cuprina (strain Ar-4) TaxID=1006006 RepID=F4G0G9_METCR|nr:hypothetical protein [Metallosphaera cuprina]AEB95856.1 conserved hypothetical protein [Metallosphaera cuprina Ar-4]